MKMETSMNLPRMGVMVIVGVTFVSCLSATCAKEPVKPPEKQAAAKKAYTFHGRIEKVDDKSLTVAGDNVDGWMGAMTMVYGVDNAEILRKVKAGDQITATVYDGDFQTLHDVKLVQPDGTK
jgi:Cu/Ag efflux protein CusF